MLVIGLGSRGGGTGVVRYLAAQEAVTSLRAVDLKPYEKAGTDVHALVAELGHRVEFDFGNVHEDEDLSKVDFVVRNSAVPITAPVLDLARESGIPILTEASIFLHEFPGPVLGVTGTKGKTSTCFWAHHLLGGSVTDEDVMADVRLVGNMGGSALDALAGATPESLAVYELSSFQIESLGELGVSTPVACLTNLHPDHLNFYPSVDHYYASKAPLFTEQDADDWRVHGLPEDAVRDICSSSPARWWAIDVDREDAEAATWVADGRLLVRHDGAVEDLGATDDTGILGSHRVQNLLVAIAGTLALGAPLEQVRARLATLPQVPNRMELLPLPGPRRWVNDTAATNPTAAAAGLRALSDEGSLTVICGGASKQLELDELLAAILERRPEVVLLPGSDSQWLADQLAGGPVVVSPPVASMREAVAAAAATDTDTVLLCPGSSSFAGFEDEFDRGGQFVVEAFAVHDLLIPPAVATVLGQTRRIDVQRVLEDASRSLGPGRP